MHQVCTAEGLEGDGAAEMEAPSWPFSSPSRSGRAGVPRAVLGGGVEREQARKESAPGERDDEDASKIWPSGRGDRLPLRLHATSNDNKRNGQDADSSWPAADRSANESEASLTRIKMSAGRPLRLTVPGDVGTEGWGSGQESEGWSSSHDYRGDAALFSVPLLVTAIADGQMIDDRSDKVCGVPVSARISLYQPCISPYQPVSTLYQPRLTDQNFRATSGSDKFRDGVEASKARTKGEIAPFQNVLELPDIASLRKKIGSHAPLPVTPPASRSLRVPSACLRPERCRKKTRMCTVLPTSPAHL